MDLVDKKILEGIETFENFAGDDIAERKPRFMGGRNSSSNQKEITTFAFRLDIYSQRDREENMANFGCAQQNPTPLFTGRSHTRDERDKVQA